MAPTQYPVKEFLAHLEQPDDLLKSQVDKENKPGARPGSQANLDIKPVDDFYADGKPYVGSGKLQDKVAWISGGDSGIGRASAILMALEGAHLFLVYTDREQKDAEDTKAYIQKKTDGKSKVELLATDLKEEQNVKAAIDACVKAFGRIDVLFNNAAQQLENHDITTLSEQQWKDCFSLNVTAIFNACKFALPHMAPGSSIINNASINAFIGRPDLIEYTSAKGAVVSFTRGLSNQIIGERKVRVNAVAPGPVFTPLVPATFSKENVAAFNATPMGRPNQPVEVATAVVFLACNDASAISGNIIHTNGGVVIS